MKDCEVRRRDQPSNISMITVDKARSQPFTFRFIKNPKGGNRKKENDKIGPGKNC
jgi:hypothetical protein